AASDTEVIYNEDGSLAQIRSTERLVDIRREDDASWIIRMFRSDAGSKNGILYRIDNVQPLNTWHIQQLDNSEVGVERLSITEFSDGYEVNNALESNAESGTWRLIRPEGVLIENLSSSWNEDRKELNRVLIRGSGDDGAAPYREEWTYRMVTRSNHFWYT